MARSIQQETRDGAELREFVLKVFRNAEGIYTLGERWRALEWLSDRGYGKPVTMVDVQAHVQSQSVVAQVHVDERAIAAMPPEEFAAARDALRKLTEASRAMAEREKPRAPKSLTMNQKLLARQEATEAERAAASAETEP